MRKQQLDKWLHGHHKPGFAPPKVYVISCADAQQYTIGVEVRHRVEPLIDKDKPMYFVSLEAAKSALLKLGLKDAFLRMTCAYEECGITGGQKYSDMPLSLTPH